MVDEKVVQQFESDGGRPLPETEEALIDGLHGQVVVDDIVTNDDGSVTVVADDTNLLTEDERKQADVAAKKLLFATQRAARVAAMSDKTLLSFVGELEADLNTSLGDNPAEPKYPGVVASVREYLSLVRQEIRKRGLPEDVTPIAGEAHVETRTEQKLVPLGIKGKDHPKCLSCNVDFKPGEPITLVDAKDDDGKEVKFACHELCFWRTRAQGFEQAHQSAQHQLAQCHRLLCASVSRGGGRLHIQGADFAAAEEANFELDLADLPNGGVRITLKGSTQRLTLAKPGDLEQLNKHRKGK